MEAHHADTRDSQFFKLSAVETLCRGCHIKAHRGSFRVTKDPGKLAWKHLVREMQKS